MRDVTVIFCSLLSLSKKNIVNFCFKIYSIQKSKKFYYIWFSWWNYKKIIVIALLHFELSLIPFSNVFQSLISGPPPASSIFNSLERRKKKPQPLKEIGKFNLKRRNSNPDPLLRTSSSSPERTRDPSPNVRQRKKIERSVSDVGKQGEKKERSSIFATLDRIRNKKGKEKKPYVILDTDEKKTPNRKKKQLSPIIEITPFKFEPEVRSVTPTVVYAEVIARPGHGKTTVHTSVSQEPAPRQQGECC